MCYVCHIYLRIKALPGARLRQLQYCITIRHVDALADAHSRHVSAMRIAFILNASSAERAALFFASHSHVASIDEVDGTYCMCRTVIHLWVD